jgi:stage V sporulation protein G
VVITEVRIKLMADNDDRLQAFCSLTFDGEFVVRDLKIIDGQKGPFVAMPSRKLMAKCLRCHFKNDLRAKYCQNCGGAQPQQQQQTQHHGADSRTRLFADIAHPINSACREKIQVAVLAALEAERIKAKAPDYVCTYDDYDDVYADGGPSNSGR